MMLTLSGWNSLFLLIDFLVHQFQTVHTQTLVGIVYMQVYARLGGEMLGETITVQYVVATAYERFTTNRAYFLHLKRPKWKYFSNMRKL
jgi:hypothetical protein